MDNNGHKITLTPIGVVRSEIEKPILRAGKSDIELRKHMDKVRREHEKIKNLVCELIIFPEWTDLLDGIDEFSHVMVLYWPHLISQEGRNLHKVHPMGREDLPVQGIFATCSPARPNPVLISAVRLCERVDNILKVQGLEAVDGSPIVDIKPYVKSYYGPENSTVPKWMMQLQREVEPTEK